MTHACASGYLEEGGSERRRAPSARRLDARLSLMGRSRELPVRGSCRWSLT